MGRVEKMYSSGIYSLVHQTQEFDFQSLFQAYREASLFFSKSVSKRVIYGTD